MASKSYSFLCDTTTFSESAQRCAIRQTIQAYSYRPQVAQLPDQGWEQLRAPLDPVAEETFQEILHKLGVDEEPTENYNKRAGNAFEIFMELFGKLRPEAAPLWIADLFTPLIHAVMNTLLPRVTTRPAAAATTTFLSASRKRPRTKRARHQPSDNIHHHTPPWITSVKENVPPTAPTCPSASTSTAAPETFTIPVNCG
ncbi:hypothetical protein C8R43DRAFT_1134616 [Mycena crocata]|nr:hypothetical protein C8R43DRAFT_1134616 [Mycena crocata]